MANNRQQLPADSPDGAMPRFCDPRSVVPPPCRIRGFRRIGRRNIPEADAWWIPAEDAWRITWRCGQIIFVPLLDHVLGRLAGFGCDTITIERCGCGK